MSWLRIAIVSISSLLVSAAHAQSAQNDYYLSTSRNGYSLLSCGAVLSAQGNVSTQCRNIKSISKEQFSQISYDIKLSEKRRKLAVVSVISVGLATTAITAKIVCPAMIGGGAEVGGVAGGMVGGAAGGVGALPGGIVGGVGGALFGAGGCFIVSGIAGGVAAFTTSVVMSHAISAVAPGTLQIVVDGERMAVNKVYRLKNPDTNSGSRQFIKLILKSQPK